MIQYYQFPSPLGISLYSIGRKKETVGPNKFPSPLGISLYSITFCKYAQGYCDDDGFRPLWGFLFIQLVQESNDRVALDKFPSPLGISLYSIEIHRKVKGEEYEFPSPLGISLYSIYTRLQTIFLACCVSVPSGDFSLFNALSYLPNDL